MLLAHAPWALKDITSAAPSLEPLNMFISSSKHVPRALAKTAFKTCFIVAAAFGLVRAEDRDVRGHEAVLADLVDQIHGVTWPIPERPRTRWGHCMGTAERADRFENRGT